MPLSALICGFELQAKRAYNNVVENTVPESFCLLLGLARMRAI